MTGQVDAGSAQAELWALRALYAALQGYRVNMGVHSLTGRLEPTLEVADVDAVRAAMIAIELARKA